MADDFNDILDHWQKQGKGRYRWEGDSGVRNFEQLTKDIGYDQGIEHFLADNPGAIEVLLEWIADNAEKGGIEWKIDLADNCDYEDQEPEDDDDDEWDPGILEQIGFARCLCPNDEQKQILDRIQAEFEANDAKPDEFSSWESQAKHQIQTIRKELQDTAFEKANEEE